MSILRNTHRSVILTFAFLCALFFFGSYTSAFAATLRLSPDTGVYSAGSTFTARVVVNTSGQAINAAEGDLSFNPADLSVVSVSKAGSIFNLWTREPEFSNSRGTISFGGGSPSGYTGSAGTVVVITFKTKHAGTASVTFSQGSILAADGKGTNVVSNLQGGSYTVQAASATPEPEYVPKANTPAAPQLSSATHPDQNSWYAVTTAELTWKLPSGVTAVRTLLDQKETTVPTKVYETPLSTLSLTDLPQGVSYVHVQFKNADGWGRVAHYRLNVDSEKPTAFTIESAADSEKGNPEQRLRFSVTDTTSPTFTYEVKIDGGDIITFEDKDKTGIFTTPALGPGSHQIVVTAFDAAKNSIVASYDLVIEAFDKPVFTEYPRELPRTVIPVIKGTTRPNAEVSVTVEKLGVDPRTYTTTADGQGVFTFIPEGYFEEGVYELTARARDQFGAQSETSERIRIAVQEPGLVRILGYAVSVLSVLIPLIALTFLLLAVVWYGYLRMQQLRGRVRVEVKEAEQSLAREVDGMLATLHEHVDALRVARKGRLTKQETEVFTTLEEELLHAKSRVRKEIDDIERVVVR